MSEVSEACWYVVHTYSGYENKVKTNILKTIENRKLQDQILEVSVPVQEETELVDGKQKKVQKKVFPGYVLINMIMNDETWYVVRNTRGVTGFVGPGSKPVPLSLDEIRNMGLSADAGKINIDFGVGDTIKIVNGPFIGKVFRIKSINMHEQTVSVMNDFMGRDTETIISFADFRVVD